MAITDLGGPSENGDDEGRHSTVDKREPTEGGKNGNNNLISENGLQLNISMEVIEGYKISFFEILKI